MGGWQVRDAGIADLPAIAAIATASGLGSKDSGADAAYVQHLLARGRVVVAVEPSGTPVGYAGAVPVGASWMLTDLFVRPDAQSRGAGSSLLGRVLEPASAWMTFSSSDLRAIALYSRAGMSPRWPLLYLRGRRSVQAASGELQAERVAPDEAAHVEASFTGINRVDDYRYWANRAGGSTYVLRHGADVVASGCVRADDDTSSVPHLCVAPGHSSARLCCAS